MAEFMADVEAFKTGAPAASAQPAAPAAQAQPQPATAKPAARQHQSRKQLHHTFRVVMKLNLKPVKDDPNSESDCEGDACF